MRQPITFQRGSSKLQDQRPRRAVIGSKILLKLGLSFVISIGALHGYGQELKPAFASMQLRTLDDHIPFRVPESKEIWLERRSELRDQLNVALGLVPQPKLPPLSATVYGAVEQEGFVVHKVIVETLPGFFLTGSLFVPSGDLSGKKLPGVLNPHGHWPNGRMYESSDDELKRLLATGAERFESAARNHLQARCVQLARMGCVAFLYDMIGYADSQQISFERAHGYGNNAVNPSSDLGENLLFSPKAEMYQQNVMGMQAINSMRAVEFLQSLDYVDPTKIAITGASGGGTQSFLTAAIDDRISGAFPAVMVSTGMQGGCTCENASYLRVNTGNIELAAMIAPRSLGLTAADDWTRNVKEDGFPELQAIYKMMNEGGSVELLSATHFPHNYNHVSRVAMYGFMNRLFKLGHSEPILEKDFQYLTRDQITVWDDAHPTPESGVEFEAKLMKHWQNEIDAYFHLPKRSDAKAYIATDVGKDLLKGWDVITSFAEPWAKGSSVEYSWPLDQDYPLVTVKNSVSQPVASGRIMGDLSVLERDRNAQVKIDWAKVKGVEVRLDHSRFSLSEERTSYLIIQLDVLDPMGQSLNGLEYQSLVPNPRPAAAYTYGYNAPQLLRRTGAFLAWFDDAISKNRKVHIEIYAGKSDAFLAAVAALRRRDLVKQLHINPESRFQFAAVRSIRDKDFLPGALRYQDMEGLLSCVAGTCSTQISP